MTKLEITLRSGATISVDVTEWKYERGYSDKLTWKTPDRARNKSRLVHVDLDEVVAIVEVT